MPVGIAILVIELLHGLRHRPSKGTPRWSSRLQRQFWADHKTDPTTWPRPDYGTRTMPVDEWGEDLIGTRDIKLCQADPRYFHHHSNGWTTYRGVGGPPKNERRLECSCQTPCSSERATYLIMVGTSSSVGPALLLCGTHADWFGANRLMGGGAGGTSAAVGETGVWRRTGQNDRSYRTDWR